jgi:thiol-disulfide isomerase/thioredoxin
MTDAPPPDPGASAAPGADAAPGAGTAPAVRRPRKRFILIGLGIGLLIIVIIGLTTSLGTSQSSTNTPHEGGTVPSFTRQNIGPSGPPQVSVPSDGGANGTPAVLLFFGNWCPSCHQELPPLAAAVRKQDHAGGALARIRVIGVDSEDTTSSARSFIHDTGVTFPVAYDPDVSVTSGLFAFDGDPYAVFVNGDGTIAKIVRGAVLTPSSLAADERALIPTGT